MNDLKNSQNLAARLRAGRSSALLILSALLALPALVQAQVNYAVSGNAAYVASSPNASGNVVITNSYDGYPVTSIGDSAFIYCTNLTSVTIPNSVTSIGNYAFYECTSLTSVTIPNSVTNIGVAAFYACTSLTSVTIPNRVTIIDGYAFYYCTSLTSVTLPNSVTFIAPNAFCACTNLTSVTIPNSVTNIAGFAFYNCFSLTSVTIPNSVTSIGPGAFFICSSLTSINVDAGNPAYSSTNGVLFDKAQATLLQFPGGLSGSYTIPNSVTSIGSGAFEDCPLLTSVTIPNSVTSIGSDAFESCSGLTSVTIPNSVTSIGPGAFFYCLSLTTAYFQGNAPPDDGIVFTGNNINDPATVYYLPGTTGWGSTFGGVPAVLWNPQANTFSFTGGQFGFNLTGPTNAVIVVEACTNLANPVWISVSTNTLTGGTSHFSDPQWTNYPVRFYRLRSSQ